MEDYNKSVAESYDCGTACCEDYVPEEDFYSFYEEVINEVHDNLSDCYTNISDAIDNMTSLLSFIEAEGSKLELKAYIDKCNIAKLNIEKLTTTMLPSCLILIEDEN